MNSRLRVHASWPAAALMMSAAALGSGAAFGAEPTASAASAATSAAASASAVSAASAVAPSTSAASSAARPAASAAAATEPASARAACAALQGSLADSAAGLKLDGATIDSATFVQSGSAASCKLTGSAALADAGTAPIRFQVSVPTDWNRHAVQFAEGVEAAQPLIDPQAAVAAGYISYGLAGNGNAAGNATSNAEAAGAAPDERAIEAQKKLCDVAQELMARRFGRLSDRVYLVTGAVDPVVFELVKRHPYSFRGVLADATSPAGIPADKKSTEPTLNGLAAATTKPADESAAAAAVVSFVAAGGKLLVLAPAGFPSTLRGLGIPAANVVPAPASEPAVLMAYRNLFDRAGERYVQASMQLYPMPPGEPRAAEKEKVDWMQVLIDWAEQGKTPPSQLAQLPARR